MKRALLFALVVLLAALILVSLRTTSRVEHFRQIAQRHLTKDPNGTAYLQHDRYFTVGEMSITAARTLIGPDAARASDVLPPYNDPIAVIADFHDRLAEIGVDLWVLPAPIRAWVAPRAMVGHTLLTPPWAYSRPHREFVDALRAEDVEVIDVLGYFQRRAIFDTDAWIHEVDPHWTGQGVLAASKLVADKINRSPWAKDAPRIETRAWWKDVTRPVESGGVPLPKDKQRDEVIQLRGVHPPKSVGKRIAVEQPGAPILMIGDSHVRWYEEYDADLARQVMHETHIPVDTLPVVGGGATRVREELVRRYWADPTYLTGRRVVVWVFWIETVWRSSWKIVSLEPFDASKLVQRQRPPQVDTDLHLVERGRGPVGFSFHWNLPRDELGEDTAWNRKHSSYAEVTYRGMLPESGSVIVALDTRGDAQIEVSLDGQSLGTLSLPGGPARVRLPLPKTSGDVHVFRFQPLAEMRPFGLKTLTVARSERVAEMDGAALAARTGFERVEEALQIQARSGLRASVIVPLAEPLLHAVVRFRVRALVPGRALSVSVNGQTLAGVPKLPDGWSEIALAVPEAVLVEGDNELLFEIDGPDTPHVLLWDRIEIDRAQE